MNYRHAYHAGNFGDVLKHIALLVCLDYLQRKEGGLCMFDSHAGAGRYDLASEEAGKTGEWERGVSKLKLYGDRIPFPSPEDIRLYLEAIYPEDLSRLRYPGSPLIAARRLRPQDRLLAAELHEPTFAALKETLAPFPAARALNMDGYEMLRAHLPPPERRGLALIDPPYERRDEFETLMRQMQEWKKRWATGVFLVWHPIKAHLPVEALKEAARALAMPRTWFFEALIAPRDRPEALNGCGLILFNAPFTVPERIQTIMPYLKGALGLHEAVSEALTADGSVTNDSDQGVA
jgi:23S rRNA (adenine2030-N6)-methyltransferase